MKFLGEPAPSVEPRHYRIDWKPFLRQPSPSDDEARRVAADHSRLAALVESSTDAIIGATLDGRITTWNRGAEALLGYAAHEVLGRELTKTLPLVEPSGEPEPLVHVLRGETPRPTENRRFAKGGVIVCVSEVVSPVENGSGGVVGVSWILRDVSAKWNSQRLLREREALLAENQRILEASRMKNAFLANMSHELRTPLNAIIGFSELLTMKGAEPDKARQQRFLGFINSSGRHLLRLINEVLDLSKVESGTFEFYPEPVDVRALALETVRSLEPASAAKGLKVSTVVDRRLTDVNVDPARLRQLLYNYLSNAIKFSHVEGCIRLCVVGEGPERFRVEVHDEGVGTAASDLPKLFVDFQQLDHGAAKQHQGTGLGLALARKLVEAQGGTVGVRSVLDKGSVFHAVLPRQGREILAVPVDPAAHALPTPPQPQLLVVDDDSERLGHLARLSGEAGFDVVSTSGRDAKKAAEGRHYDAVAMSLLVRDGSGSDVMDMLRSQGDEGPITMVVVPSDPPAAFRVKDILPKPFQPGQLAAVLQRLDLAGKPGVRILVVDDDRQCLSLMGVVLAEMDVDGRFVESAAAALDEMAARVPDAIILDLLMPDMNGFELLERLRRTPGLTDVPVIVWTGMDLSSAERARLMASRRLLDDGTAHGHDLLTVLKQAALSTAREPSP